MQAPLGPHARGDGPPHSEAGTRKGLPAGGVRVRRQYHHRRCPPGQGPPGARAQPVQVGDHEHRVGPAGPHALQKAVGGEAVLDQRDISGGAEIREERAARSGSPRPTTRRAGAGKPVPSLRRGSPATGSLCSGPRPLGFIRIPTVVAVCRPVASAGSRLTPTPAGADSCDSRGSSASRGRPAPAPWQVERLGIGHQEGEGGDGPRRSWPPPGGAERGALVVADGVDGGPWEHHLGAGVRGAPGGDQDHTPSPSRTRPPAARSGTVGMVIARCSPAQQRARRQVGPTGAAGRAPARPAPAQERGSSEPRGRLRGAGIAEPDAGGGQVAGREPGAGGELPRQPPPVCVAGRPDQKRPRRARRSGSAARRRPGADRCGPAGGAPERRRPGGHGRDQRLR